MGLGNIYSSLFNKLFNLKASSKSLSFRLIKYSAVWFILSLLLTGFGLTMLFQEFSLRRFDIPIGQMAENLFIDTKIDDQGAVLVRELSDSRSRRINSGLYWEIYQFKGDRFVEVAAKSRSLWDQSIELKPSLIKGAQARPGLLIFGNSRGPEDQLLRCALIYGKLNDVPYIFVVGEDRAPLDHLVARFAFVTLGALIVMSAGALLAIFWQVKIGLKPLFALTDEIAAIKGGRAQKISGTYPSEIMPVANQINELIDHAQETVERQRTHVGNLAHALKTPISVLLNATESPANTHDLGAMVRKQTSLMREQVDHHLRRARAAARLTGMSAVTEIEPCLEELVLMIEQVYRDKETEIYWLCDEGLYFAGERQDFLEIAGNLIENAAKFGKRRLNVTAHAHAGARFCLTVEDDGHGLVEGRYAEVLKRGHRLDESVPGSGLGLSIVEELVRAYGGEVKLGASRLGGLKAEIILPIASSPKGEG